ncbi:hypothetical protein P171DRAFT_428331 [Karstenula rhodostoma CBS 690.94]|uniref:Transmembrane protein n=1 Tax=Karstenula rhodostoma CBS 690.94 TaxID=1392251 RepID=A0A9P4UFM2_9PLEO|nr:hypothetical protein P171DRAFT_428331 [Karstenula rhodostoma CBS 690.94]
MSASQVVNVTHAGETRTGWYYHQTFENDRFRETMQALAHTSLATTANFSDSSERIVRRRIPSLQEFPADSRLDEIAMPYLEIKSLDWIHSKDEIPLSYLYLLTNITNNDTFPLSMTPSELRNPYFHGGDPGRVTIAFPGKWKGTIKYPQSQIVNGSYYVIVSRFGRTACNVSEPDVPTFGPLESLYHLQSFTGPNRFDDSRNEACFVIARLEYAAGVVTCRNCSLSAGGIIEKTLGTESLEPDPVAEQALRMTPDVLALMSVTQNWQSWILPGSLDAYTRNMLTVAYQASWNSMANYWANDTTAVQTELKSPFPALKADIAIWRVWTWLALNCLLTVSGLIVAALQWKTAAKTVCNPELSALLLDTRQVIEKGASGLCNAVKLQKQDKGLRMRLRFQDGREASHWHPYLEAEDTAVYTGVSQEYLLEEIAHAPNK